MRCATHLRKHSRGTPYGDNAGRFATGNPNSPHGTPILINRFFILTPPFLSLPQPPALSSASGGSVDGFTSIDMEEPAPLRTIDSPFRAGGQGDAHVGTLSSVTSVRSMDVSGRALERGAWQQQHGKTQYGRMWQNARSCTYGNLLHRARHIQGDTASIFNGGQIQATVVVACAQDMLRLTVRGVEACLDEVRPYLMADGGDVEVVDVQDGIVYLRLQVRVLAQCGLT